MVVFTGKAKDSFLEAFKQAVAHFKHWGHEVKSFRSDAETVLKDGKMGSYLEENGYIHELSSPEAHYQNFAAWSGHSPEQTLGLGPVSRRRLP